MGRTCKLILGTIASENKIKSYAVIIPVPINKITQV